MKLYGTATTSHVREYYMKNATDRDIWDALDALGDYLGQDPLDETGHLTEDAAQALMSGEYRD